MTLYGNEKALRELGKLLPDSKTILLSGPWGVGKFLAAQQAALAVADIGDTITHRGFFGVELARYLIDCSYARAMGTKGKAFVVECDEFSTEAINAILKVIEEPPPNTYFFLVSSVELPSTIVSRCQQVHFLRMSPPEIVQALVATGMAFALAEQVSHAGSVGAALKEYSLGEVRTNVATFLNAVHAQDMELIVKATKEWGRLEVEVLANKLKMLSITDPEHRQDYFEVALFLQRAATCDRLTLVLAARNLMQRNIL